MAQQPGSYAPLHTAIWYSHLAGCLGSDMGDIGIGQTSASRGGPSPKIAPDSNGRLTDHASRLGSSGFARAVQYFGMRVYRPTPLHSGDMLGVR